MRAYRGLASYAGRARLSTWLCQIAYHAFLAEAERARARPVREETGAEDPGQTPLDSRALLRHDWNGRWSTSVPPSAPPSHSPSDKT